MQVEVLADVSVKFAVSGNVVPCSFIHAYKRLGETRFLHLEYLIIFRKNPLCKPESEGSRLLTDYAQTHITAQRLISEQ
jgi:hypothetical protein